MSKELKGFVIIFILSTKTIATLNLCTINIQYNIMIVYSFDDWILSIVYCIVTDGSSLFFYSQDYCEKHHPVIFIHIYLNMYVHIL